MLTVNEIAQDLKVSGRTVRQWIHDKKLKAHKIQGVLRIENEDYIRFKQGHAGTSPE